MPDTLPIGTLLRNGTYRIVRFIASGGFGCTYEAMHTVFEERVAIKEFYVKDFCNRDATTSHISVGTLSKKPLVEKLHRKFIEEAKSQRSMKHPGIVRVTDVFDENGTAYYVMDYIDGASLTDILKQKGKLSEKEALDYIRQAAEALSYVHASQRLHLDIKPSNIMVDKSGRAILIDFGTSKQYDEVGGENTSTLLGHTPGYASPEQMACSVTKFMPATDVYSLGATLYKLLSGITPPECMMRVSGEPVKPLPDTVSIATRRAIEAAMRLDRLQRPQSMKSFLNMLDAGAEAAGGGGSDNNNDDATVALDDEKDEKPEGILPEKPETEVRKSWKDHRWGLGLLILAVSVAIGVGAYMIFGMSGSGDSSGDAAVEDSVTQEDTVDVTQPADEAEALPYGVVDPGLSVCWSDKNVSSNGQTLFTYEEAQKIIAERYPDYRLPKPDEFMKLETVLKSGPLKGSKNWRWDTGRNMMQFRYDNGTELALPADGLIEASGERNGVKDYGLYLTADPERIYTFDKTGAELDSLRSGEKYSLRLVWKGNK